MVKNKTYKGYEEETFDRIQTYIRALKRPFTTGEIQKQVSGKQINWISLKNVINNMLTNQLINEAFEKNGTIFYEEKRVLLK